MPTKQELSRTICGDICPDDNPIFPEPCLKDFWSQRLYLHCTYPGSTLATWICAIFPLNSQTFLASMKKLVGVQHAIRHIHGRNFVLNLQLLNHY